jgi:hypothetical protein
MVKDSKVHNEFPAQLTNKARKAMMILPQLDGTVRVRPRTGPLPTLELGDFRKSNRYQAKLTPIDPKSRQYLVKHVGISYTLKKAEGGAFVDSDTDMLCHAQLSFYITSLCK